MASRSDVCTLEMHEAEVYSVCSFGLHEGKRNKRQAFPFDFEISKCSGKEKAINKKNAKRFGKHHAPETSAGGPGGEVFRGFLAWRLQGPRLLGGFFGVLEALVVR